MADESHALIASLPDLRVQLEAARARMIAAREEFEALEQTVLGLERLRDQGAG
jgi:predicted  nucleic acid-binding Zn-ribbon protein